MAAQYYVNGEVTIPAYRPKGGMCQSCESVKSDCSALPFNTMQVIGKDPDQTLVVKCTEYIPLKKAPA